VSDWLSQPLTAGFSGTRSARTARASRVRPSGQHQTPAPSSPTTQSRRRRPATAWSRATWSVDWRSTRPSPARQT